MRVTLDADVVDSRVVETHIVILGAIAGTNIPPRHRSHAEL